MNVRTNIALAVTNCRMDHLSGALLVKQRVKLILSLTETCVRIFSSCNEIVRHYCVTFQTDQLIMRISIQFFYIIIALGGLSLLLFNNLLASKHSLFISILYSDLISLWIRRTYKGLVFSIFLTCSCYGELSLSEIASNSNFYTEIIVLFLAIMPVIASRQVKSFQNFQTTKSGIQSEYWTCYVLLPLV